MAAYICAPPQPLHAPSKGVHDSFVFGGLSNCGVGSSPRESPQQDTDGGVTLDVETVIQWLQSPAPSLQSGALLRVQEWVQESAAGSIRAFLLHNGVGVLLPLLGPLTPESLQLAAVEACAALARSSPAAVDALLDAAAPSLLACTLKAHAGPPALVAAIADAMAALAVASPRAANELGKIDMMPSLLGVLVDGAATTEQQRCTLIAAISVLCRAAPQAQIDFLLCGGVHTVLRLLLQAERGSEDHLGAVRLLADGVAHADECRQLIRSVGGIEVLVQVYRDGADAQDHRLLDAVLWALACLTYEHGSNQEGLQEAAVLLSCEDVIPEVASMHAEHASRLEAATSKPTLARTFTLSLSSSDDEDGPGTRFSLEGSHSHCGLGGVASADGRRTSADGHSRSMLKSIGSQTKRMLSGLRRLGSSLKSPRARSLCENHAMLSQESSWSKHGLYSSSPYVGSAPPDFEADWEAMRIRHG